MEIDALEAAELNFESNILPKILEERQKRKGYASFFDWSDKAIKEKGVVRDLLEAIEANEGHNAIVTIRSNRSDPPDCVGTTIHGECIGFEITELVDLETVKMNRRGFRCRKEWTPNGLLAKIREIVRKKDAKNYHGGPYSKIVLVIFTDEPLVRSADCASILRNQVLGRCRNITDCYLLLSYQPGLKSYPYFRVEISRIA